MSSPASCVRLGRRPKASCIMQQGVALKDDSMHSCGVNSRGLDSRRVFAMATRDGTQAKCLAPDPDQKLIMNGID